MRRSLATVLVLVLAALGLSSATAGADETPPPAPTVLKGFNASPEPVAIGSYVTATAQLLRTDQPGDPVPGAHVALEHQIRGKITVAGHALTGADGRVTIRAKPIGMGGYWSMFYLGRNGLQSANTHEDWVDAKYPTKITSFNASPEPVHKGRTLTVKGKLKRKLGTWQAKPNSKVYIYFKAKGSSKWRYKGLDRTKDNGWFRKKFKASKDGTWRAKYKAINKRRYLPCVGPNDYVNVR